jgi:hypothetical protein
VRPCPSRAVRGCIGVTLLLTCACGRAVGADYVGADESGAAPDTGNSTGGGAAKTNGGTVDPGPSARASLAIDPAEITVPAGRDQIFVAAGATSWSVAEGAGGSVHGSTSHPEHGLYVAPNAPGTYHVTATDGAKSATAIVHVVQMDLSVLAGRLGGAGFRDGTGDDARVYAPTDALYDGAGSLFFSDEIAPLGGDYYIRKVNVATKQVETVFDSGFGMPATPVGYDAATQTLHSLSGSTLRATDLAAHVTTTVADTTIVPEPHATPFGTRSAQSACGNTLYIADSHSIRTVDLATHDAHLFAGQPDTASVDALDASDPLSARFHGIVAVACGPDAVFVMDQGPSAVGSATLRKIDRSGGPTDGAVTTLAPGGTDIEGPLATVAFSSGTADRMVYDPAHSTLYLTEFEWPMVRAIDLVANQVAVVAGDPNGSTGSADGVGTASRVVQPIGLATDGTTVWFTDPYAYDVRAVDIASGMVGTLAGKPADAEYVHGSFADASFVNPAAVVSDGADHVYVSSSQEVVALSLSTQTVTHLAGQPNVASNRDGPDGTGTITRVVQLALGPNGDLLGGTGAVRRVALDGTLSTPCGSFSAAGYGLGQYADGPCATAQFRYPVGIARVGSDLFVSEFADSTIRKITAATSSVSTFIDASAGLACPGGLATDGVKRLWVASSCNETVQEIDVTTGAVRILAGTTHVLGDDDGVGADAHFRAPIGLVYDGAGSLYVSDSRSYLVRRIWLSTGAVSTIAGQPGVLGVHTGPVQTASLSFPYSITRTPDGALLLNGEEAVLRIAPR